MLKNQTTEKRKLLTIDDFGIFMRIFIEQCQKININSLVRDIRTEVKELRLKLKLQEIGQSIEITSTPCHFGKERFWFICPKCKGRIGTLYKPPTQNVFLCRKCHNLCYMSSSHHRMMEEKMIKKFKKQNNSCPLDLFSG